MIKKKIAEYMNTDVLTTNPETIINKDFLDMIKEKSYTRIPVIEHNRVVGVLNTKDLVGFGGNGQQKVKWVMNSNNSSYGKLIMTINIEEDPNKVMYHMIENHIHIAMVKSNNILVGLVTLEDILKEELLPQ